ncbi:glycoside hydrolase family 99-like domain-containing protein [Flavobacterium sp. M31R6]|uniref:glycosyltransferase WbsX family protein n=1 Tax=Flavobacterium sp. M31R6 TaxID=2739062 RepID=UPI0015680DDB|nr:glycoside hydrolase family 99-like domain-containing protein [Flavobacterium sp. M31R6]QKJ64802.1 glycoside hydrolase family 99-like domain-containing protein [Flavobacterium sp. M31R6]
MPQNIKFFAYYLPQYHPIDENDLWWGKGFTEWTNVAKAKPLFKGHYQPVLPGDLGFYDLRMPEVQLQQANLAKEYGIDGFIYYQYWFGNGKMLLEKPAEAMLKDENIDLPFCFCWANETWKGIWHGLDNPSVLIEQTYNGEQDYIDYFNYLLPFFKDSRYIKVDNKPMFHIYRMHDIPELDSFLNLFNTLAIKNGFDGVYFISTLGPHEIAEHKFVYGKVGIDVFHRMRYGKEYLFLNESSIAGRIERKIKKMLNSTHEVNKRTRPLIFDYTKGVSKFDIDFPHKKYIPCVFPNWDNTARSGKKSLIFKNATPNAWKNHLGKTVNKLLQNPENPQIIMIKSWNEWAEGNYLEPDNKYGLQWLESVRMVKKELNK